MDPRGVAERRTLRISRNPAAPGRAVTSGGKVQLVEEWKMRPNGCLIISKLP